MTFRDTANSKALAAEVRRGFAIGHEKHGGAEKLHCDQLAVGAPFETAFNALYWMNVNSERNAQEWWRDGRCPVPLMTDATAGVPPIQSVSEASDIVY